MSGARIGRLPLPEGWPLKRLGLKFSGRRSALVSFPVSGVEFKEAVVLHAEYRGFQVILSGPGTDGLWKGLCDDFIAAEPSVTIGHDPQEAFEPIKARIDKMQGET